MATASVQPAVLEYAPTPGIEPTARRMRAAIILLVSVLVGAFAGWVVYPRTFQATGYLHVSSDAADADPSLTFARIGERQSAVATGVTAPEKLSGAAAALTPPAPPRSPLTAADLGAKLNVRALPHSRLIAVTFDADEPRTAADVVNAVMSASRAPDVQIIFAATPPTQPRQNHFFPIAGGAVGLLAGLFIVARRWK